MVGMIGKAKHRKQLNQPGFGLPQIFMTGPGRQQSIVTHTQPGKKQILLRHVTQVARFSSNIETPVNDSPAVRSGHTGQKFQKGALPATAGAYDAEEFTLAKLKRSIFQDQAGLTFKQERFGEPVGLQNYTPWGKNSLENMGSAFIPVLIIRLLNIQSTKRCQTSSRCSPQRGESERYWSCK